MLITGVALAIFVVSNSYTSVVYTADPALSDVTKPTFVDRIFQQFDGVLSLTAQTIQAVLDIDSETFAPDSQALLSSPNTVVAEIPDSFIPKLFDPSAGSLLVNVPFTLTQQLTVQGESTLASTTVAGVFVVTGRTELNSLVVQRDARVQSLRVGGSSNLNMLQVSGDTTLSTLRIGGIAEIMGALSAVGGITTSGADVDLEGGRIYAANVVNELVAGDNITITGTLNAPIISARRSSVSTPNLETVRALGGCAECITDSDVVPGLTIAGGTINSTEIGFGGAAAAAFTNVTIGTTSATSTLALFGDFNLEGLLTVLGTGTSTFDGGINVTGGCVAVNGNCLGAGASYLDDLFDVDTASALSGEILLFNGSEWASAATSTLGLGDGSFLGLRDTPNMFLANALSYVNASGTALTQIANFVFDGTRLGIGTSTPIDTLSIAGTAGILGREALRLYNTANSNYVGFRASSTLASNIIWNLPISDGGANEILVTDGSGNLRFEDVSSVGGGSNTFVGLDDTADALINKAIPYVSTNTLRFSTGLVFDGQRLGIGNTSPTSELTVQGGVRFQSGTSTVGFVYNDANDKVGIGTINPAERLTVEGGSILQRGAAVGDTYEPRQVQSINLPANANDVRVVGQYAYVVTNSTVDNFQVIDISDEANPSSVGSVDLPASALGVYVAGHYAYVVTDFTGNDFHIIDITDPANPAVTGSIDLFASATDVFIQGRYAYVTTTGDGDELHVIEITNPILPYEIESLNLPAGAYAVVAQGDYAYVGADSASHGFYIIDISNPESLSELSSVNLAVSVNDVVVQGRYAYLATAGASDHFRIIDISDSLVPAPAGMLTLGATANAITITGSYGYVVTSGSSDDLHVIDVRDPSALTEIGSIDLASGSALGVAVSGRYAYVTTASLDDDFHVIDITGIEAQSSFVHSLESGTFSALGDVTIAGVTTIADNLRVGLGGIQTDGSIFVQGSNDSFIANKLGVGTTSASHTLTVGGDMRVTGALYDSTNSVGVLGYVLQSYATGTRWRATSSLGFASNFSNSAQLAAMLSDETGSSNLVFSDDATFTGTLSVEAATLASLLTLSGTSANIALGSNYLSGDGQDEGIYVTATGYVGIGTSTPQTQLAVDGTIQSTALLGGMANLSTDEQGNIIRDPSDMRLKTDIVTIEGALEKMLSLRGVSYKWIDTKRFGEQTEIGFIAQEVDEVIPEVVRKGGEYWSLNTRNILAVVIEGFKEMWAIVQGNQEEIELLKTRVEALEAEIRQSVLGIEAETESVQESINDSAPLFDTQTASSTESTLTTDHTDEISDVETESSVQEPIDNEVSPVSAVSPANEPAEAEEVLLEI